MSARTFLVASVLAASVAAGSIPAHSIHARLATRQNVPASCERVAELVGTCVPADATSNEEIAAPAIANCICGSGDFDGDVIDCLQDASSLSSDVEAAIAGFNSYCAYYGSGNSGGDIDSTPTGTGTGSEPTTDSEYCNYFIEGINQCWTDGSSLPTAAPVADCLCSGGSDFDIAVEGCYSDIYDSNPEGASTVAAFAGFCSSYSADGGSPVTPTRTPSTPTPDRSNNTPTQTPSSNDDEETEEETPVRGTTRVIQTGNSQPTSGSNNNGGNSFNNGNNGGSNNNGNDNGNTAAGVKVTLIGTSLAVLVAGFALVL